MATNHTPASLDALLTIVGQVKECYVEPPSAPHRGRPRTFSGQAFLLLAVVGVVLRTFKPQELCTLLTKDGNLRERLGFSRAPHRRRLRQEGRKEVVKLPLFRLTEYHPAAEENA